MQIPKTYLGSTTPNIPIQLRQSDVEWRSSVHTKDERRVLMQACLFNPHHPAKAEISLIPRVWVDCSSDGTPLELPLFPKWLVP